MKTDLLLKVLYLYGCFMILNSKSIMSLQKLTRLHDISLARKKLDSYIMSHFKAPKRRYKTFKKCEKLVMLNNIFHLNVFRIFYFELFQYAKNYLLILKSVISGHLN